VSDDSPKPPKVDPWEQRERERERWRKPRHKSRPTSADTITPEDLNLRENWLVLGLLLAISLLFLGEIPSFSVGSRVLLVQIGTGLVLLLLATCRGFQENMWQALRRGPNLFLLGMVLWTGVCLYLSPYKSFAVGEMMRIVSGVGVYFLTAYALQTPRQTGAATAGLLLLGVAAALWDISSVGQRGGINRSLATDYSALGTHENVGSLLVLFLPIALAFAFHTKMEEKRRLAAVAASLILGGALLVARTRSAWLGGLIALVVLAIFYLRFGPRETDDTKPAWQRFFASPAVGIAIGFVLFVVAAGAGPAIFKRASLAGALEDASLQTRIAMWKGAVLMVHEKPLFGWGLGTYMVRQGEWTHLGVDTAAALTIGVGHENIAHNYYVQWAADAGLPALFLHIGAITAFFCIALGGLKRANSPFVQAFQMGAIAMVCGSLVDAIGSPAYGFHGVSTVFWAWLGLAVGTLRTGSSPAVAIPPLRFTVYLSAIFGGVVFAGGVYLWGFLLKQEAEKVPLGTLAVIAEPVGPAPRGSTIRWTAVFTDAAGKKQHTMPGTTWELQADPLVLRQAQVSLREEGSMDTQRLSVFQALIPNSDISVRQVTVKAMYRDTLGRTYTAWSVKTLQ
jgi:O-antigen ligase